MVKFNQRRGFYKRRTEIPTNAAPINMGSWPPIPAEYVEDLETLADSENAGTARDPIRGLKDEEAEFFEVREDSVSETTAAEEVLETEEILEEFSKTEASEVCVIEAEG